MKKVLKIVGGIVLGLIILLFIFGERAIEIPTEKEVVVSNNVEMSGFIKSYLKVVDGTYKLIYNGKHDASVTLKVELIKKPTVYYEQSWGGGINLNVIGKNGEVFDTGFFKFNADGDEINKIKDLFKGNVGDTKNIVFTWGYVLSNEEIGLKIFTEGTSFEIIDNEFTDEAPEMSSNKNESDESVTDNSEWDDVLDEYEEYVDDYIAIMKKAAKGDMDAIGESADLMEKAQSLGTKLENAKSSMNGSQINRMLKIQQKMASAAASM